MQNDTSLLALFKEAAWEIDQRKFETIDLDTKINALGIDSVALYEIFGYVEEELDLELPDEALANVKTLRDLSTLVTEHG